jgi:hypothetical protein
VDGVFPEPPEPELSFDAPPPEPPDPPETPKPPAPKPPPAALISIKPVLLISEDAPILPLPLPPEAAPPDPIVIV